jgi:hypothetical protein
MMIIKNFPLCGKTSVTEIAKFEREISAQLPTDYREFLLKHNGGSPKPNSFKIADGSTSCVNWLFGLGSVSNDHSIRKELINYHDRIPKELLPIGDDPGGNVICLSIRGKTMGHVFFWDHEEEADEDPTWENVHLIANSFNEFLNILYEYVNPDETELDRACERGDVNSLKRLLDAGLPLDAKTTYKHTLARAVSIRGHLEALQFLADRGADLRGALVIATMNEHIALVRFLLSKRVEVDERDKMNRTPLMRAVFVGNTECAQALIDAGADVNASLCNERVLDMVDRNKERMTDLLRKAGARTAE